MRDKHRLAEKSHLGGFGRAEDGCCVLSSAAKLCPRDCPQRNPHDMPMLDDIFSLTRHNRLEKVKALLAGGVDPDSRDEFGNTVLIVACQNGLKNASKAAMRHGADLNAANDRGNTALHFCFAYGYRDTLGEYLIGKGADDTLRNFRGLTCYEIECNPYGVGEESADPSAGGIAAETMGTGGNASVMASLGDNGGPMASLGGSMSEDGIGEEGDFVEDTMRTWQKEERDLMAAGGGVRGARALADARRQSAEDEAAAAAAAARAGQEAVPMEDEAATQHEDDADNEATVAEADAWSAFFDEEAGTCRPPCALCPLWPAIG